jgi:hypothetical protein
MDLLTTYTHNPELQILTAPSLISIIHKSPQHPLSLFQSAVSSPAVPWERLLTMVSPLLPCSSPVWTASPFQLNTFLRRLPYRTDLVAPTIVLITLLHGRSRKHCFQQYLYCFMPPEQLILTSKNVPYHVRMGTYRFHLQDQRVSQENDQEKAIVACVLLVVWLANFRSWRWRQYILPKLLWPSTKLHVFTSMKTMFFIVIHGSFLAKCMTM